MTTLPTIHLNGTGRQTLIDGYVDARHAVQDAITALRKVEFNARDYYVQGNHAWSEASKERAEQFKKLREVEQHLVEILLHVTDLGAR